MGDNYSGLTHQEQEIKEKENREKQAYIWKFRILQNQYRNNLAIQNFKEDADLCAMKASYEKTVREIHQQNEEKYKENVKNFLSQFL
jgi:hypothetical protein